MRFDCLTAILIVLSLTLTGLAHDRIGAKRHWRRISKQGLAASNSTDLGPRSQLERRYDGARFSFYDAGVSACGGTFSNSDYIVALNAAQYAGGALCFQMITITANGKTTTAKIVDRCEGCPYAGLDFSRGLFDYFASESEGILYGTWTVGDNTPRYTPSTSQAPKPTPTPTPTPTPIPTSSSTPTPTPTSTSWTTTISLGNTTSAASVSSSSATPSSSASATTTSASVQETPSGVIGEMYLLFVQLGTMVVVA